MIVNLRPVAPKKKKENNNKKKNGNHGSGDDDDDDNDAAAAAATEDGKVAIGTNKAKRKKIDRCRRRLLAGWLGTRAVGRFF